jgi:hypothetical protein
MSKNCFQFEDKFYRQTFGTSMGNALSPFIAKKVEETKNLAKDVDDVFADVLKDKIVDLLALLNCQHESIKFTHEIEVNGTLPVLDVEVKRLTNNKLGFKIFRNPTNTQRFIVNESHPSNQHQMATFNSMLFQAVNVPMITEDQKAELEYIYEAASGRRAHGIGQYNYLSSQRA